MQLSLQTFASLVNLGAAKAQAACQKLQNLASGSITRAIIEASASVGLWIQYVAIQIWLGARLTTSFGDDVDSFLAQFDLTREPAVAATGIVTLSRSFGISAVIIPYFNADGTINAAGAQVLTADTTQAFGVTTDTTNAAWNASMAGYFLPSGTPSVDVPVQALVAGTSGNVQPGAISLIGISIPGVTTANNATVFSNGQDAESDDNAKARFQSFVATRARATVSAVQNAIQSVQQGLSFAVLENTLPNGVTRLGFFTVTVDDGSGSPSQALQAAVYAAIDAVRPITSTFAVQPPAVINAAVNLTIDAAPGYLKTTLQGQVAAAIETYINGLGIQQALAYTRLSALAYGVTGVQLVSNVLLNGGTADIGGGPTQTVKATGASVVIN